jgi:hypothetical protein
MSFNLDKSATATTVSNFAKAKTVGFINLCVRKPDGTAGASIGSTGIVFTDKARDAGNIKRLREATDEALASITAKIISGEFVLTWYDNEAEKKEAAAAF